MHHWAVCYPSRLSSSRVFSFLSSSISSPLYDVPLTMARKIKVAAAQVGRVDRGAPRAETLARIIKLVEQAAAEGVKLVVLP